MTARRIVGIDLGIASSHTVVVIDETTEVLARRRCRPTRESLEVIEAAALADAPDGTRLEVIVEPTGVAWLPVAVFFCRRGHVVHRVSSAKASAMRKFLSEHSKANSIDAVNARTVPDPPKKTDKLGFDVGSDGTAPKPDAGTNAAKKPGEKKPDQQ